MRMLLFSLGFILTMSSSTAQVKKTNQKQKWVTLSGKVAFLNPPEVMGRLGYDYNRIVVGKTEGRKFVPVDSVRVSSDGSYSIKLDATVPSFYQIDFAKWDFVEVFADADMQINVRGYDTAKVKIKNPPYVFIQSSSLNNKVLNILNNYEYWNYQQMIYDSRESYFAEQNKSKDSAWIKYLKDEKQQGMLAQNKTDKMLTVLLKSFADIPATVRLVERMNWRRDTTEAMNILNAVAKKYPWLKEARQLKQNITEYIVRSKMLENGKPAPLFAYADASGKIVDFAMYRGKYVLIDFWASWCGPCRQAIPKVKQLFTLYGNKGFDVLSVSIDENKSAWIKAMEDEKMPWAQVLSPDINRTMRDFMFSGIPTLYLVDPKGNIVDKYTGYSEDLETRLRQIFSAIKTSLP